MEAVEKDKDFLKKIQNGLYETNWAIKSALAEFKKQAIDDDAILKQEVWCDSKLEVAKAWLVRLKGK